MNEISREGIVIPLSENERKELLRELTFGEYP
jgi:hypothetical protein